MPDPHAVSDPKQATSNSAAGFWREVPCGHPPDPVAIYSLDDPPVLACHCGWILDGETPVMRVEPYDIVPCHKCGCHVGLPINRVKVLDA